jgi:hypothetical protein
MWGKSQLRLDKEQNDVFCQNAVDVSNCVCSHGPGLGGFGEGTGSPNPILNPKFNMDVLTCSPSNNCAQYGITGWIVGPGTDVAKFSTTQYPGIAPSTGLYVAALGYSATSGSILQTLGATVQANTTYILTVEVGARADYPFTGYVAYLLAGNVTLASGHRATPVGGTFVTEVVGYESGATPAQLGQPLQILITSTGDGQVDIQSVALTALPTAQ